MSPLATPSRWALAALAVAFLGSASFLGSAAQAQSMGPYEPDAHTRVLLQFEEPESATTFQNRGIAGDAQAVNNARTFPGSAFGALGRSLYIDNDAVADASWAFIPHEAALDLAGDMTIELWFNILSYGTSNADHRFYPSMLWKNGGTGNHWSQGNYFAEVKGDTRYVSTGYYAPASATYPSIQSANNLIQPGQWYHVTFIRSTEHAVLIQLVHNAQRELIYSAQVPYNPETQQPNITDSPLILGQNGNTLGDQSGWFDGFLDEIRVSDVVRPFLMPPVVARVQVDRATRVVSASVADIGASQLSNAVLRYRVGATGAFQEVPLVAGEGSTRTATLPDNPGAVTYYYIAAENAAGLRTVFPAGAEAATPDLLSFFQEGGDARVLALDFEQGQGTPLDVSGFGHLVAVGGQPTYTPSARVGDFAYQFNGDTDYLQIPSPVIGATGEYTLSMWANVESFQTGSSDGNWQFWAIKPEPCANCWGESTFSVLAGAFDRQDRRITTRSWVEFANGTRGNVELTFDTPMDTGAWYRVVVENRAAPAGDAFDYYLLFQLRNAQDEVVETKVTGYRGTPLNNPNIPLRLGLAQNRGTAGFQGTMDHVEYFNHSAGIIEFSAAPSVAAPAVTTNPDGSHTVTVEVTAGLGSAVNEVNLVYFVGAGGTRQTLALSRNGGAYTGTIPATEGVVYYYVSATNAQGLTAVYPENALAERPEYLAVAAYPAQSTLVLLDFEDGSTRDRSGQDHLVHVFGNPETVEGPGGTDALRLDGVDDRLVVWAGPVGGSEPGFAYELTFRVDDFREGTGAGNWAYLVNKPNICPFCWGEQEFSLLFGAYDDPNKYLAARFWNPAYEGGQIDLQVPVSMTAGTWYTGRVEVAPAGSGYTVVLQLLDAVGTELGRAEKPMAVLPRTDPSLPIFIGQIGNRAHIEGAIDRFAFYNHPAFGLSVSSEGEAAGLAFSLGQTYPNPASGSALVAFTLGAPADVALEVFDLLGRRVATVAEGAFAAGTHTARIDTAPLASGTYVYRLRAGSEVATGRMTVLR